MRTVGIIGCGVVGRATARCWMEHGEVKIYDVDQRRRTHEREVVSRCEVVFVCLPTPDNCDTRLIEEYFAALDGYSGIHVIKSTVPVGTTRQLAQRARVVHSPEFLTARCALVDSQCPSRIIFGQSTLDPKARLLLHEMHERRFPGVPIHWTTSEASELIKLATNGFFATKVWYFNELYRHCQARGIPWHDVRCGILSDGRIAHAHTQVPGPDGRYGFGGTCLPKDLRALAGALDSGVLAEVLRENERLREGS